MGEVAGVEAPDLTRHRRPASDSAAIVRAVSVVWFVLVREVVLGPKPLDRLHLPTGCWSSDFHSLSVSLVTSARRDAPLRLLGEAFT